MLLFCMLGRKHAGSRRTRSLGAALALKEKGGAVVRPLSTAAAAAVAPSSCRSRGEQRELVVGWMRPPPLAAASQGVLDADGNSKATCTSLIWEDGNAGRVHLSAASGQAQAHSTTSRHLVALLQACGASRDLAEAQRLQREATRQGLVQSDIYVGNALVSAFVKCGDLALARRALDAMPRRDVVSWTALIHGYAKAEGGGAEALRMYMEMRRAGVAPNRLTYAGALKACGCSAEVRRVHADSEEGCLEGDVVVATALVDAYARCGGVEEAGYVFESMSGRDVVAWNAMVLGYARAGMSAEAVALYARMKREGGVVPDRCTYLAVLRACGSGRGGDKEEEGCVETVRGIHADIVASRVQEGLAGGGVVVDNMLVDVYAKCGSLEEARVVFESMPKRDVVSWNTMILGYAQAGTGEEALRLYARMTQQEGVVPDDRTYVSALKACTAIAAGLADDGADMTAATRRRRCLESVGRIYTQVAARPNLEALDTFVGNALVDAYAKCGDLGAARGVFNQLRRRRDVVSWNSMISGYAADADHGDTALELYARMVQKGKVVPDARTLVGVLRACSALAEQEERCDPDSGTVRARCLATVRAVHDRAAWQGCDADTDVLVGTALVDAYRKCGGLDDARAAFERLPRRDVVAWSAMIAGYAAQAGGGDEAVRLFERMVEDGVAPNARTWVGVVQACGSLGDLETGKRVHARILAAAAAGQHHLLLCPHVTSSLVDMYAKCGSMADAQRMFDAGGAPGRECAAAWSALILGYASCGDADRAFALFHDMTKRAGVAPDGVTFLGLLKACAHAGLVDKGREYLAAMTAHHGIAPSAKHTACVVDLLARAGQLEQAVSVATASAATHTAVWTSILAACRNWATGGGGAVESILAVARRAFAGAVRHDPRDASAYVLMSAVYAAAGRPDRAQAVEAARARAGATKPEPGRSWWVDPGPGGGVHAFVVGDRAHPTRSAGRMLRKPGSGGTWTTRRKRRGDE